MLADHAAGVAAVGAGLRAEARRVGDELQRQRFGGDDLVAQQVGHRHFGGGDEIQLVRIRAGHVEQVFLELRQLPGATHRLGVHQVRHIDFGVAVFRRVHVEHELGERPVQLRQRPLHHGKAAAGDLHCGSEVELAEALADIDMVAHREIEGLRRAPAAHFDVGGFILTHRHRFVRQVRHAHQEIVELGLQFGQARFQLLQFVAQTRHLGHHRGGVLALALQHADLLRQGVAATLRVLGAGLDRLALGFQRIEARRIERKTARRQALGNEGCVFAQQLDIKHRSMGKAAKAPFSPIAGASG